MNRRMFLKSVPAVTVLGVTAAGLAGEAAKAPETPASTATAPGAGDLKAIDLLKPQADGGKSVLAALKESPDDPRHQRRETPAAGPLEPPLGGVGRQSRERPPDGRQRLQRPGDRPLRLPGRGDVPVRCPGPSPCARRGRRPAIQGGTQPRSGRRQGPGESRFRCRRGQVRQGTAAGAGPEGPRDPEVLLQRRVRTHRRQRLPLRRLARSGRMVP